MQLPRPDHSFRTFWREEVESTALRDAALEAALPGVATLSSLAPSLLAPGVLPNLWRTGELTYRALIAYFAGGTVVQVERGGYTEPVSIPRVGSETLAAAVHAAVRDGVLWLTAGPASLYREDVPDRVLSETAVLQAPPEPVKPQDILAPNLPEAWAGGSEVTTAGGIADALATRTGKPLPWSVVRQAIEGAFAARYLERTPDSGSWPCDMGGAASVRLRVPASSAPDASAQPAAALAATSTAPVEQPRPGVIAAEAYLRPSEIQELADQIGELTKVATAAGIELTFHVRIEVRGNQGVSAPTLSKLNDVLEQVSSGLAITPGVEG
ncbi:MAG: hypothetical protein ACLQUY_05495 [Ktedonobacterales bacterium]